MKRKLQYARIFSILIFALLPIIAAAAESVSGSYFCESVGSKPCQTNSPLQLSDSGSWRWGSYFGHYTINNGHLKFSGFAGPSTWGNATIASSALIFNEFGDQAVWRKANRNSQVIKGVYYCKTAPYGCMTSHPLEMREDGTWALGSQGGNYAVVGTEVRFRGGLTGGFGGQTATLGSGTLLIHTAQGESLWASLGPAAPNRPVPNPRVFDLGGFPRTPTTFEEQRIMAAMQAAEDPQHSANPAVFEEQGHRMLGQWYINHGDPQRGAEEQQKALYWKNGGR